jgi:hypothetical protein
MNTQEKINIFCHSHLQIFLTCSDWARVRRSSKRLRQQHVFPLHSVLVKRVAGFWQSKSETSFGLPLSLLESQQDSEAVNQPNWRWVDYLQFKVSPLRKTTKRTRVLEVPTLVEALKLQKGYWSLYNQDKTYYTEVFIGSDHESE